MPLPNDEATPPVTKMYFVSPTTIMFLSLYFLVLFLSDLKFSLLVRESRLKKRKIIKKKKRQPLSFAPFSHFSMFSKHFSLNLHTKETKCFEYDEK